MKAAWERFDVNADGNTDIADPVATLKSFGKGDGRLRVRCFTIKFKPCGHDVAPFSAEAAHGVFMGEGVLPTAQWLQDERARDGVSGRPFEVRDYGVLYSKYTQEEIAGYPLNQYHAGLQGAGAPDYYGEHRLQAMVIRDEFGLASYDGDREWWRNFGMVYGGGGIAQAPGQMTGVTPLTYQLVGLNYASAVIGDWRVYPWLTWDHSGAPEAIAIEGAAEAARPEHIFRVVGHEGGHSFAMQGIPIDGVTVSGAAVWHTNYVDPAEPPGTNPHVAYGGLPLSPDQRKLISHPIYDKWLK